MKFEQEFEQEFENISKRLPFFVRVSKKSLSEIANTSLNPLNLFVATDLVLVDGIPYLKLLNNKNLFFCNMFEVIVNIKPN